MKKAVWLCVPAACLSLALATRALAAPLNPAPTREGKVLYSFETKDLDGWISDPDATGANQLASQNTDPAYVSDGAASLKLDVTNVGGWKEPILGIDIATPIDLSDYNTISMDVYTPAESLNPDNPGGWYQFIPRLNSSGGTTYFGNRDLLHSGWNHLSWSLVPSQKQDVSHIHFIANTDAARPFTGPVYIDNIRVWKDSWPGLHSDETLIAGFDTASDLEAWLPGDGVTADLNTDKTYVIQGDGSAMVDLNGATGWKGPWLSTDSLGNLDLSKALAIRVDVYVPKSSAPTDWWQLGFAISGPTWTQSETMGLNTDQWDTIELALSPDMQAGLTAGTHFEMHSNNGAAWTGPIYIDNLRYAVASAPPPPAVVKGDVNGNSKLDIADVVLLLKSLVGLGTLTDTQNTAADVDGNTKVAISDAVLMLKALAGIAPLPS